MLSEIDRIVVTAVEREPVVERYQKLLGAEVLTQDTVRAWAAERTLLQVGASQIEVMEADGVGVLANSLGRRGPGLFAVGFAAHDLEAVRARLVASGVAFEQENGRLVVTSDEGVDLPGANLLFSEVAERKPAGALGRLFEASMLVRDDVAEAQRFARFFGLDAGAFHRLRLDDLAIAATLALLRPGALDRLALVTPHNLTNAPGRYFKRHGPCLYMAFAETDDLDALQERLEAQVPGHCRSAGEGDGRALFLHPKALGGLLLGICRTSAAWAWSGHPEKVVPPPIAGDAG